MLVEVSAKESERIRKEILRLWTLYFSNKDISERLKVNKSLVARVIHKAQANGEIIEERRIVQ